MNQTIGVNITPQSFQPTLHFSQGDVGRVFVVNVTDYDIPSGATVTCVATKPSGMGFTVSGTVSGNQITFTSTAEMTDEWGRFPAEIRIASGSTLLGTANFLMIGEKDPHPASTIDGTQEELIPQLTLLVNRVEVAAESVHDLTVSATTLTAGSDATATYDSTNNSIAFGIPRGADGDVTRSEFNDLKSEINDIHITDNNLLERIEYDKFGYNVDVEIGTFASNGTKGSYDKTVRTNTIQQITENLKIVLDDDWRVAVYWYNNSAISSSYYLGRTTYWTPTANVVYIAEEAKKITGATYFCLVFFKWTGSAIDTSTAITTAELNSFSDNYSLVQYVNIKNYIEKETNAIDDNISVVESYIESLLRNYSVTVEIGTFASNGTPSTFDNLLRTKYPQKLDSEIKIQLNDNWRVAVYWYADNEFSSANYLGRTTFWAQCYDTVHITNASKAVSGAKYFGLCFFRWNGTNIYTSVAVTPEELASFSDNYTMSKFVPIKQHEPHILVAASDSPDFYKATADYVCAGTNDELVIQSALDEACNSKKELWLAVGNYSIDHFYEPLNSGDDKYAICLKILAEQHETVIKGVGGKPSRKYGTDDDIGVGAILRVSRTCYGNLSASDKYAVITGVGGSHNVRKYPWLDMRIENIGIVIPDNQKKIIGIDGYYASAMTLKNLKLICTDAVTTLKNGVQGCIGIRGMCGSAFGVGQIWEHCFVWGFHTGYAVAGEHLVCIELGARFCDYGYRFNDFDSLAGHTWLHPITLINCCDECDFNMPYFGNSGDMRDHDGVSGRQTFNLIDFNFEWLSEYAQYGGDYATEEVAGCAFVNVTYTIQGAYGANQKNRVNIPFWANGYGENSRSTNMAHKLRGTTAERLSYAPNPHQQYFDTDLNKMLVYEGGSWVDMMGNAI